MNSLQQTKNNSAEQEEPKDQQLGELPFSCFHVVLLTVEPNALIHQLLLSSM